MQPQLAEFPSHELVVQWWGATLLKLPYFLLQKVPVTPDWLWLDKLGRNEKLCCMCIKIPYPARLNQKPLLALWFTVKLVVRWADITQLEKSATLLLPDAIKVSTRINEHVFSVFLNINETFKLAEQLANIAMRQLLDNKGFEQDRSLPKLKKKSPKKVSALKRSGGTIVNTH